MLRSDEGWLLKHSAQSGHIADPASAEMREMSDIK